MAGPGWRAVAAECPGVHSPDNLGGAFAAWLAGLALVYGALFGSGFLLLGSPSAGLAWSGVAVAGGLVLLAILPRLWSAERPERGAPGR